MLDSSSSSASLELDESLPLLDRLSRCLVSPLSLQRLVHTHLLAECAQHEGPHTTLLHLLPLLQPLACDAELSIRQGLAEQLLPLSRVLLEQPEASVALADGSSLTAYQAVVERVVPLLSGLLNSRAVPDAGSGGSTQVLDAAAESLIGLAGLMRPDDVGSAVLTSVLCLAHDNEADINRVVATQLLGSLAPVVSSELCCQFILPELISLADDPVFRVRKAAALKIGSLCLAVGPELTVSRLLPVFETLCHDDIWGVRKACVESIADVTTAAPIDAQTGRIVPLLRDLYNDSSRWVKVSTCQIMGPFLAALPSEAISAELLLLFTQLANPANPNAADTDISYYCAFNFPAVVQAVGAPRWPELAEAFRTLTTNIQWKVRRTLSFSMHELAKILGPELTEMELVPTFDYFLKDLDEVKVGVLTHFSSFLKAVSPAVRLKYLSAIAEVRAETDNWRFRHSLAMQLADVGPLFPRESAIETLLPLVLDLSTDPVAEVRSAAMLKAGTLIALLIRDEPDPLPADGALGSFLRTVCNMASSHSCHRRANCAQICTSLVAALPTRIVSDMLLPELVSLASDPIPTVRLLVARLVKEQLLANPLYSPLEPTRTMAESLRADSDRDVLRAIHDEGFEPPPYVSKSPMRDQLRSCGRFSVGGPAPPPDAGAYATGAQYDDMLGIGIGMEAIQLDPLPPGVFTRGLSQDTLMRVPTSVSAADGDAGAAARETTGIGSAVPSACEAGQAASECEAGQAASGLGGAVADDGSRGGEKGNSWSENVANATESGTADAT